MEKALLSGGFDAIKWLTGNRELNREMRCWIWVSALVGQDILRIGAAGTIRIRLAAPGCGRADIFGTSADRKDQGNPEYMKLYIYNADTIFFSNFKLMFQLIKA